MKKSKGLIYTHALTSNLIGGITAPFLPLFYYEIAGKSFLLLSLANTAPSILAVFLSYFWARLSDAYGKRKPFVILSSLTGLTTTLLISYASTLDQLLLIRIAGAFTGSAGGAAFSALLAKAFKEKRGRALGLYSALSLAGSALGNMLSAYAYEALGMRTLLRLQVLASLLPFTMILLIPEEPEERRKITLKSLIVKPKITNDLLKLFALKMLLVMPSTLAGGLIAVYYINYLGGSEQLWALLATITTLLGLSVIPYGYLVDKVGAEKMLIFAGIGWLILYLGYYYSTDPLIFAAFFVIPVWPAFQLSYSKLLMDLSDKGERATLYATENMMSQFYAVLLGLLGGYLADVVHPKILFLIGAAAAGMGAVYAFQAIFRKHRGGLVA